MVKRLLLVTSLTYFGMASSAVLAETIRMGVIDNASKDSDEAYQDKHVLFFQQKIPTSPIPFSYWLESGQWFLNNGYQNKDFTVTTIGTNIQLDKTGTVKLEGTKLYGDGWNPTLGNVTYTTPNTARWRGEISTGRDIVDSVTAIDHHDFINTNSASTDYDITSHLTATGQLYRQNISDGNHKLGKLLRLTYQVPSIEGLHLRATNRYVTSDFEGVGYFSPRTLEQNSLGITYAQPFAHDKWRYELRSDAGIETIDHNSQNQFYKVELHLIGWFGNNHGADTTLGCTNTADNSNSRNSSSYRYCYINWQLFFAW